MSAPDNRGFTLLELVIVVALIGILATIGMAGLVSARRAANEASAIASLRAIILAQHAYASSCAGGYYASSLPMLASPPPDGSPFISPDLGAAATVHKSGYAMTMARGTDSTPATEPACNPLGAASDVVSAYYATADPVNGFSGSRHFWTNTLAVIFFDPAAPIQHRAGLTMPPTQALGGQGPGGGGGTGGTGKPGEAGDPAEPGEGKGAPTKPDAKAPGPRSPQRK